MHKIIQLLKPIIMFNIRYPVLFVTIATLSSCFPAYFAVQLTMDTDIANFITEIDIKVQSLAILLSQLGGETEMQVAIQSAPYEPNVAFLERLSEESLELYHPLHDFR